MNVEDRIFDGVDSDANVRLGAGEVMFVDLRLELVAHTSQRR